MSRCISTATSVMTDLMWTRTMPRLVHSFLPLILRRVVFNPLLPRHERGRLTQWHFFIRRVVFNPFPGGTRGVVLNQFFIMIRRVKIDGSFKTHFHPGREESRFWSILFAGSYLSRLFFCGVIYEPFNFLRSFLVHCFCGVIGIVIGFL